MPNNTQPTEGSRLGFHYFPDQDHYRESDLRAWLPELKSLGASWLILEASVERAVPEDFIRGLVTQHIEPVLHFKLPLKEDSKPADLVENLTLLFEMYAHWGARYVILFDRPNARASWPPAAWAQASLVERFLDHYLPLAEAARRSGLIPVFPPLEPGGDYWDTAFLREALQAIERRGFHYLLDDLVLSAIADPGAKPLNWGAGGPERWPKSRPYHTPDYSEDQRGFRIFDWYIKVAEAVTGVSASVLLVRVGCQPSSSYSLDQSSQGLRKDVLRTLTIAQALAPAEPQARVPYAEPLDSIPAQVIAGCFWLLAADKETPQASAAWYQADGVTQPYVGVLRQWFAESVAPKEEKRIAAQPKIRQSAKLMTNQEPIANRSQTFNPLGTPARPGEEKQPADQTDKKLARPIRHYLLLPLYEWGVADWHLDVIRPFVKKYRPTVGFSLQEARFARKVTVVGGSEAFSEEKLESLRAAGCSIERIQGDGTSIATQLATN
jgi:hypothetical protein